MRKLRQSEAIDGCSYFEPPRPRTVASQAPRTEEYIQPLRRIKSFLQVVQKRRKSLSPGRLTTLLTQIDQAIRNGACLARITQLFDTTELQI